MCILLSAGSKLVSFLPSKAAPNMISGVGHDPTSPEGGNEVAVLDGELVAGELGAPVILVEEILLPPAFETMLPWLSIISTLMKPCQSRGGSILAGRCYRQWKKSYRGDPKIFIKFISLSTSRWCRCCCCARSSAQVSCNFICLAAVD